ncbi:MAG TPA: hypothetical protein VNF47_00395 [Streptosporangiaceae bacterium]|nr:hypothetical protein [Streptosporangiaceae bacterium]
MDSDAVRRYGRSLIAASRPVLPAGLLEQVICAVVAADRRAEAGQPANPAGGHVLLDVRQNSADTDVPGELWEPAAGTTAATRLYDHAVRTIAVLILHYMWGGLETPAEPDHLPPGQDFTADPTAISLN